ncbi:MAG: hypothetical protein F4Z53_01160 [Acidimicrobiales bacterium]|nr:hypothetical protein [Acidimicrobiales bacterium]MYD34621.1 hypothetical protein [Acidimicrobiales bacterium]MYI09204.1 hypothetical protein [Acidimicrobiales bacterium]
MNRFRPRRTRHRKHRRAAAAWLLGAALVAGAIGYPPPAGADELDRSQPSKSYDEFIDAVWAYESDIDPSEQSYYNDNWDNPVESYPEVEYPGRVIRDDNGDPVEATGLTIEEFFKIIGIGHLYSPADPSPDWRLIQSNVINYLGFVGFRFQESDLVDLGYYEFETTTEMQITYPIHYVDVPNSHWAHGVREFVAYPPIVDRSTIVRDVVVFADDFFTGKNGINNYADFTTPDKHILVIKDHFENKYQGIVSGLSARGKTLQDYLDTEVYWNQLDPPVNPPPGGRTNDVKITLSGLLAGAHLRGAEGVVSLLVDHKNPSDENGTYILQYVQDYAGYDTPFGNRTSLEIKRRRLLRPDLAVIGNG